MINPQIRTENDNWSRHWDTLSMTAVTIATAALAIAFAVLRFQANNDPPFSTGIAPLASALLSLAAYVSLATLAGITVFLIDEPGIKRIFASAVYLTLIVQIITLSPILIIIA